MSSIAEAVHSVDTALASELWGLAGFSAGNDTMTVPINTSSRVGVIAVAYEGVDQTTPTANASSAEGDLNSASGDAGGTLTVSDATSWGIATIWVGSFGLGASSTLTPDHTDRDGTESGGRYLGFQDTNTEPGAGSVEMDWAYAHTTGPLPGLFEEWVSTFCELNVADAGGVTTKNLLTLGMGAVVVPYWVFRSRRHKRDNTRKAA